MKSLPLSVLVLFLFALSSCEISKSKSIDLNTLYPPAGAVTPYHNDWTINNYQQRIKTFKENPLNKGEIVFIGNSITQQGKDWSERFGIAPIRNRGIAGDVTDGVLKRLGEIIYNQPKAVFVLIGVNDLSNIHQIDEKRPSVVYKNKIPSAEYIGENILKIANTLHEKLPKTKIFLRTILPANRPNMKEDLLMINQMIKDNEPNGNYQVIDLFSQFATEQGDMKKELTKDGVHLNDQGYDVWVKFEKSILEKL